MGVGARAVHGWLFTVTAVVVWRVFLIKLACL